MEENGEVGLGLSGSTDIQGIQSNSSIEMNSNVMEDNSDAFNCRPESMKECGSTELTPNAQHFGESESYKDGPNSHDLSSMTDSSESNGNNALKSNNSLSNDCVRARPAKKDLEVKVVSKSPSNNMAMLMDAEVTDDALVISNANARPLEMPQHVTNQASNSLLLLSQYDSDESLDGEEDTPPSNLNYREDNKVIPESDTDSDSDSSSSSSSSPVLISDSSDTESDIEIENKRLKPKAIKAKGEVELTDLPPIEDLQISVPLEECTPIGKIFQIVDVLVVVQAFKNSPAYDVDTVLFLDGGKPLGKIFEVFGPVCEPHYCVRFNSQEHIKERNIVLEQMVYSAPKKTEFTKFVFLSQLMKMKGTDASWIDDFETPESLQDYSDDEQEQMAKRNRRNGKAAPRIDSDPEEPARKKHFAYEKRMNERNLQLSTISNRRINNNQQAFFDSPSCSSMGLRNPPPPRFREFIRHRFGFTTSIGRGTNHFFPSGPKISDSSFTHNFQTNIPNTGGSHSPRAFMPHWSPLSGPHVDPRSQPFSSPFSGPYGQNECPRPSVQTPPNNWNLPPMQPPLRNMPPIGTHPSLPLMNTPPPNMPQVNTNPPNLPSMAIPPPNMPPMSTCPPNISLMRTPPPNMPPMSTPPPLPTNLHWTPNMFFSNNLNSSTRPMQRNLIRPPSLPSPPPWSFNRK